MTNKNNYQEKNGRNRNHRVRKHSGTAVNKRRKKSRAKDFIPKEALNSLAIRYADLHREILDYISREDYKSKKAEDLANILGWNDTAEHLMIFLQMLRKMELDYEIVLSSKNRYMSAKRAGIISGTFLANPKGFGFVKTAEPDLPDIYIHRKNTGGALHKDTVLIRVKGDIRQCKSDADFRPEGEVLKITAHANQQMIGVFDLQGRNALVYPDEKRLAFAVNIPFKNTQNAEIGDKVIVQITDWGGRSRAPMGKVIRVLGKEDEKGVDMLSVLWQYNLPEDFPAQVLRSAEEAATKISEADLQNRRDMRNQPLITIDGADAKDLDDAVSCRRLDNGKIELSVHIADVAHYVKQDSVLDREAFERGTSVYLPDRVIPMLPRVLSNGMCSLNAGVDRLAMSCTMEINDIGNVENYDIYQSVIKVDKRFDYDTVNLMLLDKDEKAVSENREWLEMLEILAELQKRLEKKRRRHGAINFNMPETKVIVDFATGETLDVVKREQRLAEKMIEQAMVVTNETVATHYHKMKVPFVYRVHEGPGEEKLRSLNEAILPLGLCVEPSKTGLKPKDFQKMLKQVSGKEEETFVQTLALRSMCHAEYSPEAIGHFGLASRYYSHFTSPIRRYADLSIHRVVKACFEGRPKKETLRKIGARVAKDAEQASVTERLAEEAERSAVDLKCCQFMADKIGQEFIGHVSGLNNLGIWVELPNTIEGRIAAGDLPADDYNFIKSAMTLKGRRYSYRLGDEIKIIVDRVDLYACEIDFIPAE
ncbi:MAG: ribonuclease R [Bacillota bacterium]|jgi:ribonuclease R